MAIFQLTGLSGAGKTTLATKVVEQLLAKDIDAVLIDGDVYRKTICKDLGFTKEDRLENIRRLGLVAEEFSSQGKMVIIAAINPYETARQDLAKKYGAKTIWVKCDLSILQQRDTKGLYKKANLPDEHPDKIILFTGVSDIYENPVKADLVINTGQINLENSINILMDFILMNKKAPD